MKRWIKNSGGEGAFAFAARLMLGMIMIHVYSWQQRAEQTRHSMGTPKKACSACVIIAVVIVFRTM
jgi:phosphoglycerate-specific signal transduction histidine kinase